MFLSLHYQKNKGQINWIMKNENQNPQKQKPCLFYGLGSKWHKYKG
jgi:hypothetical protein